MPVLFILLLNLVIPPDLLGPAPSPTPKLPTIITLRARPLCTALHKFVLPFTNTERQNNVAFRGLDRELGKYRQWEMTTLADTGQQGTFTANGAQLLQAGKMDQQATNIFQSLADVQKQLSQSYHDIPVGNDPKLDDLRARIDNIVKLQYALAARYDLIAGKTLDQIGFFNFLADDFIGGKNDLPDYNAPPPADSATPMPPGQIKMPGDSTEPISKLFLIDAPGKYVATGMMQQEVAFVQPALDAVNTCDPPAKH